MNGIWQSIKIILYEVKCLPKDKFLLKSSTTAFTASTSNFKVAFGGILGGAPLLPYAYSGGHINVAFYPFFNSATPSSHPLITWPAPKVNSNGPLPCD